MEGTTRTGHDGGVSSRADRSATDDAVCALKDKALEFARLGPGKKAALVRECIPRMLAEAPAWTTTGARARGSDAAEEWLVGPTPTIRVFRLLADSLDQIAKYGRPPLGTGTRTRSDGRIEISLAPASTIDRIMYARFGGYALTQTGVGARESRERQANFYQRRYPEGGVAVVLGAGNVSSIPPLDAATKMFNEGMVCALKVNPVNEWVGPILERVLGPIIEAGYLRIFYGGSDVGAALVNHPAVDQVHVTGSDRTHDTIVWGPPGVERERRKIENDPLLQVPISSELGNVSPVAIVPYDYSDEELWFQARNLVTMVVNNASFNCNAAKMLITARGWRQRDRFLELVERGLSMAPTRTAYYPGAFDRYRALLAGHREAVTFGQGTDEKLEWAMVPDLDSAVSDEPLFSTEPFCGILSETSLGSVDPVEFLASATSFMNERLWGTLNATLVVHPKLQADPVIGTALDRAIVELRYGTIAINHWPALCYAFGTMPWGGHPSSNLRNVQSGLGWVHNTFMLDGIDKSVLYGPLVARPYPLWFFDNTKLPAIAPKVADLEASPSWLKLPALLASLLF